MGGSSCYAWPAYTRGGVLPLILYSTLFYLLIPAVLLRLMWRSLREPEYRADLLQRFGFFRSAYPGEVVWIHAVSAGETIAAVPLIEKLVAGGRRCLVTNMTPTGRDRCRQLLGHLGDKVENAYAPYDLPGSVGRFLAANRPSMLLVIDTELWPNMLQMSHAAGLKTALVNGRLSAKSADGYRRIFPLIKPMLQALDVLAVQTQSHCDRFVAIGAPEGAVSVTGSIKFDASDIDVSEKLLAAQERLNGRPAVIGASTHPGEEEALLDALPDMQKLVPELVLVLAPRHTQRAEDVVKLIRSRDVAACSFTEARQIDAAESVFLLDVMGEMQGYLAAADIAFVGGSLAPVGGHNLLEAVRGHAAVVMGPHLRNIDDIAGQFREANAMLVAEDAGELKNMLTDLLSDTASRRAMTERAFAVLDHNRGALDRVMALI